MHRNKLNEFEHVHKIRFSIRCSFLYRFQILDDQPSWFCMGFPQSYSYTAVDQYIYLTLLLPVCKDNHARCAEWAKIGECYRNKNWMQDNCAKSCRVCGKLEIKCTPLALLQGSALNGLILQKIICTTFCMFIVMKCPYWKVVLQLGYSVTLSKCNSNP